MDDKVNFQVLIRAPHLEKMRDPPMDAVWNRVIGKGSRPEHSELTALIDFGQMDEIFANFLEVTGLPVAIIDLQAKVLASSKWQRICLDYHRVNVDTLTRCLQSDVSLSKEIQAGKDIAIYRCHNGLTDCAAPIVVDGQHVANLFIGQFLLEQPDLVFFKRQQEQFGFDEEEYFKALAEVPIVSEAKLPAILNLISGLARQVADLSLARMKALQAQAEVESKVIERTRQLSESEARLNAAERIAHIGNWELDLALERLSWSAEIFRIFEIDPQRFGASYEAFLEAIHPDDREAVNQAYVTSLTDRRPYEITHRLKLSDGHIKYVHERCETHFDAEGKPLRSLGTVQDVTERKLVELALRESETLYRELFKASGDAIFVHGILPSGEPDRFVQVNKVACERLGYSEAELLSLSPREIDAGGMDAKRLAAVQTLLAGGHALFEMVHVAKDGRSIPVEISARCLEIQGRTMVLSVVRDITERKRVEMELEQYRHHLEDLVAERTVELDVARARAEAANRAKSSFLANMSHEIRTPMNAIIGLTHLLQRQQPSEEQQDKLDKISGAAHHLLNLINDVLDFSKIEAGRMSLDPSEFELSALVGNLHSLVNERMQAKGLTFVVDMNSLPERMVGDSTRLTQVLLNYLGNAVKFTESGRITLRGCKQAESEDALLVRFEVTDSGIGIAADKIVHLFGAFEQVDTSTTRRYGGTGLGLAINKRLAQMMGGEVGVESQPGQGSTFWFTAQLGWVSRNRESPAEAAVEGALSSLSEHQLQSRYRDSRVLLVEDEPINQYLAVELLAEIAGLKVDVADNGQQAVGLATANPYDLILMDMQMPVMDGLAATRAIRKLPGYAHTPVLAMTANAFGEDRQRCLDAGMDDHIPKPFSPDQLFGAVLEWLRKKQ